MQVTITINNRGQAGDTLTLFGARHNFMASNFGNKTSIELNSIKFSEEYKSAVGIKDSPDTPSHHMFGFTSFMLDCVKFNFVVDAINGQPLKTKIPNTLPQQYEILKSMNPYTEEYEHELSKSGFNEIVIDLYEKLKQ